ncbi:hypothetical protein D3C87_2073850 [compost metagenome]
MRNQALELYDLSKDISEKNDLATTNPTETKKLAAILGKTLKERNAQMPVESGTSKPVPFPDELTIR